MSKHIGTSTDALFISMISLEELSCHVLTQPKSIVLSSGRESRISEHQKCLLC